MRSFGNVLTGKSCAARQALDVAPNMTSKNQVQTLDPDYFELWSQIKSVIIMNMCSWSQNSWLHILNRDYPLPLSNGTVFFAFN